jgi:hypothetical protein
MNEHIIATVVIGNESITLFRVEPLNCTVIHEWVPPQIIMYPRKTKPWEFELASRAPRQMEGSKDISRIRV